jgi:amidophosphoribosyltransferase
MDRPQPGEPAFDLDGDTLREECGVFGIYGHPDAAPIVALGLHALQHRGQEAAGIVSFDGRVFHSERKLGLVGDSFSDRATIERLEGASAIGHVRYSTTGGTIMRNVQPLFAELEGGGFAVAHNGNLTNGLTLRRNHIRDGAIYQSTTDTEAIVHLVARSRKPLVVDRFIDAVRQLEGAFSLVALTNKKLIGARDPLGIRPLVIGELGGRYILASETCALDIINARFVRDVQNGEMVVISDDGLESIRYAPPQAMRPCIFEYIYFSRPDSIVNGRSVYDARKAMGAQLAREAPADADVVVPVPDSGVPAALGFGQECGIPYELGIIRNHYVGRTFIEPTQSVRELGVRLKHSANRAVVGGRRIVLVDDSLVRGTTSVKIVRMMREAGASEVHFRIASPPITHPDFYGIDTPERDKLLAATHDLEEHAALHRRRLARLSVRSTASTGRSVYPGRRPRSGRIFKPTIASPGDYPTRSPHQAATRSPRQALASRRSRSEPWRGGSAVVVALVTGASRALVYCVASAIAAEGAHVVALARTVGGLEELDDASPNRRRQNRQPWSPADLRTIRR